MPDSALCISNLSYHYGENTALDNLSFSIEKGQFFGLLGPNGAGKSTLLSLLTRLLKPAQGSIEVFSRPLAKHPNAIMAEVGVVFQQTTLDLDLSVLQNLSYHGALHGLSPRLSYQRADEELSRFGLQDKRHCRVRELNGGHRRRLELARAMLHRPRLLLLDEPTSGLDVAARKSLNRHVRALCAEKNIAALWTTHLIEELHEDDSLLILNRGRACAQGGAAELLTQHRCRNIGELFETLTGTGALA